MAVSKVISLINELAVSEDNWALIKIASIFANTRNMSSLDAGLVPALCSKRCQFALGLKTTEIFYKKRSMYVN